MLTEYGHENLINIQVATNFERVRSVGGRDVS
uniref:Uncharacterized protein n=1 Tax=Rhizophora mucronata TaxID=61149 RepID=A0A2P2Q4U1_RHIMU